MSGVLQMHVIIHAEEECTNHVQIPKAEDQRLIFSHERKRMKDVWLDKGIVVIYPGKNERALAGTPSHTDVTGLGRSKYPGQVHDHRRPSLQQLSRTFTESIILRYSTTKETANMSSRIDKAKADAKDVA
jgi:hypothetical protein